MVSPALGSQALQFRLADSISSGLPPQKELLKIPLSVRVTYERRAAPGYRNEITLARLWQMVGYDTESYARRVGCPLLAISAIEDESTPAGKIYDALDGMRTWNLWALRSGHYGLFWGSLEETERLTMESLKKHL